MQLLAVDIGTGTQDILLFNTDFQPENCFKLVMPSPTMQVAQKVKQATRQKQPILLQGYTMGGGPSHWAVRDHVRAGNPVFITPQAARTFNDDLERVQEMGAVIVSDDEVKQLLKSRTDLASISCCDFNFKTIQEAFRAFGVSLSLDGVAVAVFDHGAAPPNISDRKFRFDYLEECLEDKKTLSTFAHRAGQIPKIMTRLQNVADSAYSTGLSADVDLMVMDTSPAAILGALLDPKVKKQENVVAVNIGNMHTLAFRIENTEICGVFEHHTGHVNKKTLDQLLRRLIEGSLTNEEVFDHHGHGALVENRQPLEVDFITVLGPRRGMMKASSLPTHFAAPYGDMMLTGCFGLVRAWADVFPDQQEIIKESLFQTNFVAPWELL